MKKLVALGVVALVVVGIVKVVNARSPEGKARAACENLASQCESLMKLGGEKLSSDDIDECSQDLSDARDELGDEFGEVTGCMADADSCGEALGCLVGGAANALEGELDGFARGFERARK
jgi:hypothetical protein